MKWRKMYKKWMNRTISRQTQKRLTVLQFLICYSSDCVWEGLENDLLFPGRICSFTLNPDIKIRYAQDLQDLDVLEVDMDMICEYDDAGGSTDGYKDLIPDEDIFWGIDEIARRMKL